MDAESIISRIWSFCTTLRDDGVSTHTKEIIAC